MPYSLPTTNHESAHVLSGGLIRGLKNACTVLAICTALFGGVALLLTIGEQWMHFPDFSPSLTQIPREAINTAHKGITIVVDNSAGAFSATLDIVIETCFSIALFLTLKRLLSSLHHKPTAPYIAIGLRKIAIITIIWPIAAVVGQIIGGCFSRLYTDDYIVNLNPNLPMLATGVSLFIGSIATRRLALAEQELESVI